MLSLLISALAAPTPADKSDRLMLSVYATCVVEEKPDEARKAVLEDWQTEQLIYRDLLRENRCVAKGVTYRFPGVVFKAAMAGALIRRDLVAVDPATITASPALHYIMPEPVRTVDDKGRPISAKGIKRQQEAIADKVRWIAIAQFGECVARANPAAVPALANSVTGSDAELGAIKAFGPQMPGCLPTGLKLELDRSTLRGSITLAYYRLAMAARQGVQ